MYSCKATAVKKGRENKSLKCRSGISRQRRKTIHNNSITGKHCSLCFIFNLRYSQGVFTAEKVWHSRKLFFVKFFCFKIPLLYATLQKEIDWCFRCYLKSTVKKFFSFVMNVERLLYKYSFQNWTFSYCHYY